MIPLLVQEIKLQLIEQKFTTEKELDDLLANLYKFINDENYFLSMPRVTQIYGKKIK